MDNTSELLDGGFGLYSTTDLKKNIGPVKTEYFRISLTRKGNASFDIIQLCDKKYIGHWGILDLHSLMAQLTA